MIRKFSFDKDFPLKYLKSKDDAVCRLGPNICGINKHVWIYE